MIISRSEKELLSTIAKADSISVIKLRTSLGWNVSRFASAFIALEEKGLIIRSGSKVMLSAMHAEHFNLKLPVDGDAENVSYFEGVRAAKIDVSQPYLPNYYRFKAAQKKSLYTRKVSIVHPE